MDEQTRKLNRLAAAFGFSAEPAEGVPAASEESRPWIELPRTGRPMSDFARECAQVCRLNGVFRREAMPVWVNDETGGIELMTPEIFRTYIEDLAVTYKMKKVAVEGGVEQRQLPDTMTRDMAGGVLRSLKPFVYKQRRLERVNHVRQPIMRDNGTIELLPIGYDEESGILTRENDVEVREMETLEEARQVFLHLFREFEFAGWNNARTQARDLAALIGAMVSFFGSGLLPDNAARLGALFNANAPRSGKTLLFKACVIPVLGSCRIESLPRSDEDFRKVLDKTTLGSLPYVILDDVGGLLASKLLNAFITARNWSGHLMYSQKGYELPQRSMVFVTGNNLDVEQDLAGRLLQIVLEVEETETRRRNFETVLNDRYLAKREVRGDVLSALWTLIRHWDKTGRKPGPTMMGDFEEWCEIFGGIVHSAGFGDPCERPMEEAEADREGKDMRRLVQEMAAQIEPGDKRIELTFSDLVEIAVDHGCFEWVIDGRWVEERAEGHSRRWFDLKQRSKARLGDLFGKKYASGKRGRRFYVTHDGAERAVQFQKVGEGKTRRYVVTLQRA